MTNDRPGWTHPDIDGEETAFGAFSPVLPVPVDERPDGPRNWGDVYYDVMDLLAAYDALTEAIADGAALRTVGEFTTCINELEERLRIAWSDKSPDAAMRPYAADQPRRWRYRVC